MGQRRLALARKPVEAHAVVAAGLGASLRSRTSRGRAQSRRVLGLSLNGVREHWQLCALLTIGAVIRTLTMVAYTPALFFSDSWGYLSYAYPRVSVVSLPWLRPIGYSLLIKLFAFPFRSMTQLVGVQHVCGLLIGSGVYSTLERLRVPRWAAAAASALVLLDGYAITLEQYVMADIFFSATLFAALLLLVVPVKPRHQVRRAVLVGLLLAFGALQREVGVLVLPVPIIYLIWARAGWRPVLALILAAAIPLTTYAALVDLKYKQFGLTAASGWVEYGRVAGVAECAGVSLPAAAKPLCETAKQRRSHPDGPDWYIWGPSPAVRLFDPAKATLAERTKDDAVLKEFAQRIAAHEPWNVLEATLDDFARFFRPTAATYQDSHSATSLPRRAAAEVVDTSVARSVLPGLRLSVRSPAGFVTAYRSAIHVPRPVLALLAIIGICGIVLRVPSRREVFLFVGSGLLLLLGTAATGGFSIRYLVPAIPLLAIGGTLASVQLWAQLYPGFAKRIRSHRR